MPETRDGRSVELRSVREGDLADIVEMEVALVADGRGQVRLPADLPEPAAHVEVLRQRLPGLCWWCAVLEGKVVAAGSIGRAKPSLVRHLGWFELGVAPEAQGLGIGELLSLRLIEQARADGVLRLELGVRADNPRAIALYEKLGFATEVVRQGYVRLPDGTLLDDLCMVRWL